MFINIHVFVVFEHMGGDTSEAEGSGNGSGRRGCASVRTGSLVVSQQENTFITS